MSQNRDMGHPNEAVEPGCTRPGPPALEAIEDDKIGAAFTAFGCLTMTTATSGAVQVAFDGIALAACAWGLHETLDAEDTYFDDLKEQDYQKAEIDLQKVEAGLFGSFGGCAVTLWSIAAEE